MCGFSCPCTRDANLLVTVHYFDAFAFNRTGFGFDIAQIDLVTIQFLPTLPITVLNTALLQQLQDSRFVGVFSGVEMVNIFNDVTDGLQCVTFSVANQAHWTALNPAGGVESLSMLAVSIENATFGVFDDATLFIELNLWDRRAEVAHRTVDRLDRVHFHFAGAPHISGTVQFHALHTQASNFAVFGQNFFWSFQEMQMQAA